MNFYLTRHHVFVWSCLTVPASTSLCSNLIFCWWQRLWVQDLGDVERKSGIVLCELETWLQAFGPQGSADGASCMCLFPLHFTIFPLKNARPRLTAVQQPWYLSELFWRARVVAEQQLQLQSPTQSRYMYWIPCGIVVQVQGQRWNKMQKRLR